MKVLTLCAYPINLLIADSGRFVINVPDVNSVYLVREVLYDPPDEDCLSPLDSSFMFDSVASISSLSYQLPTAAISPSSSSPPANGIPLIETKRPRYRSWSSDPFTPAIPIYGRSFALKCLCKKDLSEELVEVQRGEAVLHRALPEHEYIVRLYGVSFGFCCSRLTRIILIDAMIRLMKQTTGYSSY